MPWKTLEVIARVACPVPVGFAWGAVTYWMLGDLPARAWIGLPLMAVAMAATVGLYALVLRRT